MANTAPYTSSHPHQRAFSYCDLPTPSVVGERQDKVRLRAPSIPIASFPAFAQHTRSNARDRAQGEAQLRARSPEIKANEDIQ